MKKQGATAASFGIFYINANQRGSQNISGHPSVLGTVSGWKSHNEKGAAQAPS